MDKIGTKSEKEAGSCWKAELDKKTQPQLSPSAGGEMGRRAAAWSQPGETKHRFKIAFSAGASNSEMATM